MYISPLLSFNKITLAMRRSVSQMAHGRHMSGVYIEKKISTDNDSKRSLLPPTGSHISSVTSIAPSSSTSRENGNLANNSILQRHDSESCLVHAQSINNFRLDRSDMHHQQQTITYYNNALNITTVPGNNNNICPQLSSNLERGNRLMQGVLSIDVPDDNIETDEFEVMKTQNFSTTMNNPLLLLCEPGDISTTVAKENTASSPPLHKYDDGEIQALQVRSKTIPTVLVPKRPRGIFLNEIIWNVDDTVYCGGLEAVINLNVLCRLNIEYVVDLSGSDEESASRRNECPCLCARKTPHSRFNMAIKLNDEENLTKQNLMNYFEEVINLIKKAKACKKCVLIHSDKGRNRAPAFVAAYLMHNEKLTRVQAMMKIAKLMNGMRPGLSISDNFQRALMKWQSHRGIKSQAGQEDTPYTRMFTIKKAAWT